MGVLSALSLLLRLPALAISHVLSLVWWLGARIISCGPIPEHVALVLDGNRRWARQRGLHAAAGHTEGFVALRKALDACWDIGVKTVTVFAFSVENFKRPADEVSALMQMARDRLAELESDAFRKRGAAVRIIGDLSRLPSDVREVFEELNAATGVVAPDRPLLNICFSYTAQQEIVRAVRLIGELRQEDKQGDVVDSNIDMALPVSGQQFRMATCKCSRWGCDRAKSSNDAVGVLKGARLACDKEPYAFVDGATTEISAGSMDSSEVSCVCRSNQVLLQKPLVEPGQPGAALLPVSARELTHLSEETFERRLHTGSVPGETLLRRPPDMVLRTSGETRLSDFLLWQCSFSQLLFVDTMWPDFGCWQMFYAVLEYQCWYPKLKAAHQRHAAWLAKREA